MTNKIIYTKEQLELKSYGVYCGPTVAKKMFDDSCTLKLIEKIRELNNKFKSC